MGYASKIGARTIAGSSTSLEFTVGAMGAVATGNTGYMSFAKDFIYNLIDDGYNLYMKNGSYASSQYSLKSVADPIRPHASANIYTIIPLTSSASYTNYRSNMIDYFVNHDESRFLYIAFQGSCTANNNGAGSLAWIKFDKE